MKVKSFKTEMFLTEEQLETIEESIRRRLCSLSYEHSESNKDLLKSLCNLRKKIHPSNAYINLYSTTVIGGNQTRRLMDFAIVDHDIYPEQVTSIALFMIARLTRAVITVERVEGYEALCAEYFNKRTDIMEEIQEAYTEHIDSATGGVCEFVNDFSYEYMGDCGKGFLFIEEDTLGQTMEVFG